MKLQQWIDQHRLDAQISSNICSIDDKKFLILEREEENDDLFDSDFDILLSDQEKSILIQSGITQVLFQFGNNWYFSNYENIKLNIFKYIGRERVDMIHSFPYLGIHGEYDLCNGSRLYKDWCQKAKFLGTSVLGICETNTLAGTLSFQMACKDVGIKSILGETVTVKDKDDNSYKLKLYCMNEEGWRNLLNINAQIKVFNEGYVEGGYLSDHNQGLVCVIDCSTLLTKDLAKRYQKVFGDNLYYQLDFVEWLATDKETEHLKNLKTYIDNYIDIIKPVIICDSYYLDKEHGHIKKILNSIGKVGFQNQSKDQYFKSIQDIYLQIEEVAPKEEWMDKVFFIAVDNVTELASKCDFEIKLGELHLPKYEMTEQESSQFETNEDLFFYLVEQGFEKIKDNLAKDEEEYLKRIELEIEVIKKGGFIDYFLITWDILNWCKLNGILTGAGRGSAAGSLISYLFNITKIDPLRYDLLFERFLNEGRLGKSLPDIDNDIPSDRRDDVKRYMEMRYGIDHVTSIGTYGTFKIKSGITDLCREYSFDLKTTKYITSIIADDLTITDFFRIGSKIPMIKSFIQQNPHIIEDYPLLCDQVKNASIHAAGVIIVPKTYNDKQMTIYDWMPIKKVDGVLVTEWEGPILEAAGFLKEDILGVRQLQKLSEILRLIKINHGDEIELKNIPLDDENVFALFQEGYNEDVFQLGAPGLKAYCRELKPDNIEDLIATVALYRPGPMETGIHKSFIKVKNGLRLPEYDYMMEDITKNTFGLIIYQEQIMQIMQVLGGFNLVEADNVRKAIGKSDLEKMMSYKDQFLHGAVERGCDQYEAVAIWMKIEAFGIYAFNRSHAAVYAHTGYYCQWLKFHYPLEFWSVALNSSSSDEISRRVAEMHKVSEVRVLPPDINQSTDIFEADRTTKEIFWSIGSIKQVGEKTLESIMKQRKEKGNFFSFDEFYRRVEKRSVNKRHVVNLILSGCFDKIEKVKTASGRIELLRKFLCDIVDENLPAEFTDPNTNWKDYFWILKQKELTGFGYLEFDKIYNSYIFPNLKNSHEIKLVNSELLQDDPSQLGYNRAVIGILTDLIARNSKNGPFGVATLSYNDENVTCIIWSEIWESCKEVLINSKDKIICITGETKHDTYRNEKVLQTNSKTQIEVL